MNSNELQPMTLAQKIALGLMIVALIFIFIFVVYDNSFGDKGGLIEPDRDILNKPSYL